MMGLTRCQLTPCGPPMILYHDVIDEMSEGDVEVCAPISAAVVKDNDLQGHELCGGEIATTVHHGPYEELA